MYSLMLQVILLLWPWCLDWGYCRTGSHVSTLLVLIM